ncbi:hypothetical protein PATSB16_27820 [Pandoraea thiooxydans]|nr:hypothetical protein PATSB16_27820 [Pandoraea thiooxydans]
MRGPESATPLAFQLYSGDALGATKTIMAASSHPQTAIIDQTDRKITSPV